MQIRRSLAPAERLLAERLRVLRKARGLSQAQLASALGISMQQMQKYEAAVSRIGASRLHAIATLFEVPVSYFFSEGGPDDGLSELTSHLLQVPGALELLELYAGAANPLLRRKILALVETAAGLETAATSPDAPHDLETGDQASLH